jgi:hypothetical protein
VGEVPPGEGSANEGAADKRCTYDFQEARVPQLQEFQGARYREDAGGDQKRRSAGPQEGCYETPEYLIHDASGIVVKPPCARASVKLAGKPERGYYQEGYEYRQSVSAEIHVPLPPIEFFQPNTKTLST